MLFSEKSDVTVVITCCGRKALLKETLNSLLRYNTYPLRQIIITEDAGDASVHEVIPEAIKPYVTVLVNQQKLGQILSIDKAYSLVETDYIFHCEEDWQFYRKGFIEDSRAVLESNDSVYQVWLRSFYHDVKRDYPFHSLGEQVGNDAVEAYRLLSSKEKWQGFSFNPGLRRRSDYLRISGGYASFLSDDKEQSSGAESALSQHMKHEKAFAAILANDAVAHIGYGQHVMIRQEKWKKLKKKASIFISAVIIFNLGWLSARIY